MLAATLVSIGFSVWFLVGVIIEGRQKAVRYVICFDYAEGPMVHTFDESTVLDQADDTRRQHSMRFSLNHVTTGTLRKAPRLRSS